MKKVLVTGAGGFIGSHLARYLLRRGYHVRVVDIKWDGYIKEPYYSERLTLDLRNLKNCLVSTRGIKQVYNLAADMGGIGYITKVSADIQRNNVLINANMIEASRLNKVERYFFSSSACVYPNYLQEKSQAPLLKEPDAMPADPNEAYGWEKLFTEILCESYEKDYGLNVRVGRYHNVFGPECTWKGGKEKAPAALCRKVALAPVLGEITLWGDGEQTRSFLYIDDCLEATYQLMHSDYSKPINIGSDRLVTINELTDLIIKTSGKRITKKYDLTKPQGVRGRNADLTIIKNILKWSPKWTLENGLKLTYEWILSRIEEGG